MNEYDEGIKTLAECARALNRLGGLGMGPIFTKEEIQNEIRAISATLTALTLRFERLKP